MESVQSCLFPLAAEPPLAALDRRASASTWTPAPRSFSEGETSPRKTRARNFCPTPSGRMSRRARFRSMFTPGCRACAYKTASGRAKWPNRDPLEEVGGANLYVFIRNDGINDYDLVGLVSIRDIASSAYNQLNSAWSSAGDAAAQEIVGWFKAFDSQAKLRVNFQVQKRYQVGASGAVKFYVGGNLRVVSDGCCVTVAGGGFANGSIRLGPPVGWSIAGGITGNLNGKYTYCWTDGTRDLTGVFDLSANAGARFGFDVLVGEVFGEVGVYGRYRKDLKTWENSTAVGVYGRAVFRYGSTVREYRVTYGTGEGGEGF